MRSITLAAAIVLGTCSLATAQDAKVSRGEKVFTDQKCSLCHSIGGHGNAKGPLDDVGSKLSAADIKAWLRTPKEMTAKAKAARKPPMPAYGKDKIPDADLDALTAYLSSLKK